MIGLCYDRVWSGEAKRLMYIDIDILKLDLDRKGWVWYLLDNKCSTE